MYALEDEPESGNRWRRLGAGALIAASVLGGARLRGAALRADATPDPEGRADDGGHRAAQAGEAAATAHRAAPSAAEACAAAPKSTAKTAAPPKSDTPPAQTTEPVVGLDGESFGSGEGASFQVGNTQLGEPVNVAQAVAGPLVAPAPSDPPTLVPAGVPPRVERCRYSSRAQRLGLEGLMIIEVNIDDRGHVKAADLRHGLEEELDRECLEAVRGARFEPATLGGAAVASTRFLRLRFELER